MSWQNEIKDASYTSPSGKSFSFLYDGLEKEVDLKSATFTFPGLDGALVVSFGRGGRRFPMTCKFFGADCLKKADEFEAALEENGIGELQHPIYGARKVVPTGSFKRSDNLVSDLNVSVVSVTFSETIVDETFPDSDKVSIDGINDDIDDFISEAAAEFESGMSFSKAADKINAKNTFSKVLDKIKNGKLATLAKKMSEVYTEFQQALFEVESAMSSFNSNIQKVAMMTINLCRIPCKAISDVSSQIEGMAAVAKDIIENFKKDPIGENAMKAQVASTRLALQSLVCSLSEGIAKVAVEGNAFKGRDAAMDADDALKELYDTASDFLDEKTSQNSSVDTGESYSLTRDIVFKTRAIILNSSFALASRKTISLSRDRQIFELLAELYGGFDRLDEFVSDNNLTADELEIIRMGREVSYYV